MEMDREKASAFKKAFREKYTVLEAVRNTYAEYVVSLINSKGWDVHQFVKYTKLEANNFHRIKRGDSENPKLETVLSISIGMKLPPEIREELIALAGIAWQNTELHCAYQYILENKDIKTITDFNTAFIILDVDPDFIPLKDSDVNYNEIRNELRNKNII